MESKDILKLFFVVEVHEGMFYWVNLTMVIVEV